MVPSFIINRRHPQIAKSPLTKFICVIRAHNFCEFSLFPSQIDMSRTTQTKMIHFIVFHWQRWHHRCHTNLAFWQAHSTSNRLLYSRVKRSNFTWHGHISTQNKGKLEHISVNRKLKIGFCMNMKLICFHRECIWMCWHENLYGMSD